MWLSNYSHSKYILDGTSPHYNFTILEISVLYLDGKGVGIQAHLLLVVMPSITQLLQNQVFKHIKDITSHTVPASPETILLNLCEYIASILSREIVSISLVAVKIAENWRTEKNFYHQTLLLKSMGPNIIGISNHLYISLFKVIVILSLQKCIYF